MACEPCDTVQVILVHRRHLCCISIWCVLAQIFLFNCFKVTAESWSIGHICWLRVELATGFSNMLALIESVTPCLMFIGVLSCTVKSEHLATTRHIDGPSLCLWRATVHACVCSHPAICPSLPGSWPVAERVRRTNLRVNHCLKHGRLMLSNCRRQTCLHDHPLRSSQLSSIVLCLCITWFTHKYYYKPHPFFSVIKYSRLGRLGPIILDNKTTWLFVAHNFGVVYAALH